MKTCYSIFMSELQHYFETFSARCAVGEGLTPEECACHGSGWLLSQVDTWHKCPDHFKSQPYPEDDIL